jgi:hypothetical protein
MNNTKTLHFPRFSFLVCLLFVSHLLHMLDYCIFPLTEPVFVHFKYTVAKCLSYFNNSSKYVLTFYFWKRLTRQVLGFPLLCDWRFRSPGMWHYTVGWSVPSVSMEHQELLTHQCGVIPQKMHQEARNDEPCSCLPVSEKEKGHCWVFNIKPWKTTFTGILWHKNIYTVLNLCSRKNHLCFGVHMLVLDTLHKKVLTVISHQHAVVQHIILLLHIYLWPS